MNKKELIREVVQSTQDFNEQRLWLRFTNKDCFGVRLGETGPLMLVCVMGDGGEEFGMMLLRGPGAVRAFAGIIAAEGPDDDAMDELDFMSFSMVVFASLPAEMMAFFRQANVHPKAHELVPFAMSKPSRLSSRLLNNEELSLLLAVTRGTLQADRQGLLEPAKLGDPDGICVLTITGDPAAPDVSVARECVSATPVAPARTLVFPEINLADLPRLEATWLVATPSVPASIKGDDRSMRALLVMDAASQQIVHHKLFFAGETQEALDALTEVMRGQARRGVPAGLPRRMIISSRKLHDALLGPLTEAGVLVEYETDMPEIAEVVDGLQQFLMSGRPNSTAEVDDRHVPDADDLDGWKAADARLTRRLSDTVLDEPKLRSSRSATRYFGEDDIEFYMDEYGDRGVMPAFGFWCVLAYRPTRKSKTRGEKLLQAGLPNAEEQLLRARLESYPSLYRIVGLDVDGGTVDLEDLLLGGTVTVHDQMLAENIDDGVVAVFRVFQAGQFHFADPAGPPVPSDRTVEAIDILQDEGLTFTPESLRRDAHLFGRLWAWLDTWETERPLPHLRNMDGDELLLHTASFSVADPTATRTALQARDDCDYDEQADEFVWLRDTGQAAEQLNGPVVMGRIEFVGDELILSVNSAARYAQGLAWLTELPGVSFCDVTTQTPQQMRDDPRANARVPQVPEPVPPELIAQVQEMVNQQYRDWIDTSLPVLENMTPREACRTVEGRQRVAALIRSLNNPAGNLAVTVPREAMLRELGIEGEREPDPETPLSVFETGETSEAPSEPLRAAEKVGRNDPCPCGSGRKYKKCCGA